MHVLCLCFVLLSGPSDGTVPDTTRPATIQAILEMQDQRRGADPQLVGFLTDKDPGVRERATIACASIQDTSLLPRLLERLRDESPSVREAAAFAIGQTGSILSVTGQAKLETECLDQCMLKGSPPRLIEEIGKFGTVASLSQLTIRAPSLTEAQRAALVMGIARFAIRGIVSDNATQFLIRLAEMSPYVAWQTVYALQRIAPRLNIDIQLLLPLAAHQDPLIRMNAAALVGKVPSTLVNSALLARLSSEDPDWRVRVNATKAMASAGPRPPEVIMDRYVKAFSDSNEHVALSAMAAFGETFKGSETIPEKAGTELWKIAENKRSHTTTRRQAEAITALAKIERSKAYGRLAALQISDDWLLSRYIVALGESGDTLAAPRLSLSMGDPTLASSALEGLRHLAGLNQTNQNIILAAAAAAVQGLDSRDIAVLSTAASMLEDSLFRTPKAVPSLLKVLKRLHEPDDVEAMQQIIQTLGTLRDNRATAALVEMLSRGSERAVVESALKAVQSITGQPYRGQVRVKPIVTAALPDPALLRGLEDTVLVRMETSAGNVVLELYPKAAPYTVMSFLRLSSTHFFDSLRFHRVVPNFVVQGGDPRGDGWGGPGYSIRSEFSLLRYDRGMLGMASSGKDTEGSQFFITHSPQPHLDGRYTIFGKVREGTEVVDRLQVGDRITQMKAEISGAIGNETRSQK